MKITFVKEQLADAQVRAKLSKVVTDVDQLCPQNEGEFGELMKFGLYPASQCQPFVTKQGTPFYHLDNMSLIPKGDSDNMMHYADFEFRQIEVLYNMVRIDSAEAHTWLCNNLFQNSRVDARKKSEYKAKFRDYQRQDWKEIQIEWMKYCLMLKYRDNALFRKDLVSCAGKLPVEDATNTNYASNLFWGARLVEVGGEKYYFGCNVLGKLLAELRNNQGKLDYTLPADLHLFGKPIEKL